jgi:hypothetical protein
MAGRDDRFFPAFHLTPALREAEEFLGGVLQALEGVLQADAAASGGVSGSGSAKGAAGSVEMIPAGFRYRGITHNLTGRPRDLLAELLRFPDHRALAGDLREAIGADDEAVNLPEQVVRDAAAHLRRALRRAVDAAGLTCDDPLPSLGRGKDLTYRLDMP